MRCSSFSEPHGFIRRAGAVLLATGIAIGVAAASRGATWSDSGDGFRAGVLGNSGENIYVNRRGELETIRRFDLDGNGYVDLLFNSSHDPYHYVPATMATASRDGTLEIGELGVDGSARAIPSDLNRDGYVDLLIMPNRQNIQRKRSSLTIAWGAADGWSSSRLSRQLPVNGGFGAAAGLQPALYGDDDGAVGDFNRDGWPDILVINTEGWIFGQPATGRILRAYWGGPGGFILTHLQDFGVPDAVEVAAGHFGPRGEYTAAVLRSTGQLDLLAPDAKGALGIARSLMLPAGADGKRALPRRMVTQPLESGGDCLWISTDSPVLYRIVPGSGTDAIRAVDAPAASEIAIGRLDDDPWPDLVLTSLHLYFPGEEMPDDTHSITILWGSKDGIEGSQRSTLSVPNAICSAVGDLNGDGHGDLAVSVHQGTKTTEASSRIFFGDGTRRLPREGKPVPTMGAQGVAIVQCSAATPPVALFDNCVQATLNSAVPVRLYWGTAEGYSTERHVDIPNVGGYKSSAADLNSDGKTDIIIVNGGDASAEDIARSGAAGANIYWGGTTGPIAGPGPTRFDTSRTQVLPEPQLGAINVADLNRDGYLDIVLGNFDVTGNDIAIYYGSDKGYGKNGRRTLHTPTGRQVACLIVDSDKDGWLDIVATDYEADRIFVYRGGPGGFSESRAVVIDYPAPIDAEAADLNRDGWLDLITGSYIDNVADRSDMGLSIFWGGPGGWVQSNSLWLPGMTPVGLAVADIDADGYLDIVSPHYHGELTREQLPAYVYWGSAEGFRSRNRTPLIVDSGHDVMITDVDHDGMLDLAFSAHSTDPGHILDSPIYFNDGKRFRSPRVQYLPVIGPHYMWEQDIGNVGTRRYEEDFTSRVFSWNEARSGVRVSVDAAAPPGAGCEIRVRTAADSKSLGSAEWRALSNGSADLPADARVLQYHLTLRSPNGDAYPVVRRVDLTLD